MSERTQTIYECNICDASSPGDQYSVPYNWRQLTVYPSTGFIETAVHFCPTCAPEVMKIFTLLQSGLRS